MSYFRVGLRFYPNQANPARASGKGVWRVCFCTPEKTRRGVRVWSGVTAILCVDVRRTFTPRSRIDPAKWVCA
jgi:hypothetical protein